MHKPRFTPRKMFALQSREIYEEIKATSKGHRCFILSAGDRLGRMSRLCKSTRFVADSLKKFMLLGVEFGKILDKRQGSESMTLCKK